MNSVSNITSSSIAQEQLEVKRAETPKEVRGLSAQEEKLLSLTQECGIVAKKDTFVMYEPYYKHIKAVMKKENFVSDEAQFFECLCEYGLYKKEPSDLSEDNALFALFWEDCKRQIDKNREKDKNKTKEGFTFWRTFYNAIYEDTPSQNGEWLIMFNIYCLYGFDMIEPEPEELQSLSKIARKCWVMDKPHFVANWIKVYNGNKGGRPKPTHNQPITTDNQGITKPNQPLSNIKENKKENKNKNINEKENENGNGNEVASSLSQDNNFSSFSSSSSSIPTLEEIEKFVLSEHLYVMPEDFFNYYNKMQWRGVNDWRTKAREWSKREKQVNDDDLLQLKKRVEQRKNKARYDALWEKIGSYKVSIDKKVGRSNWYAIDERKYLELLKEGCTEQQIIDSYKLVADMGFIYLVRNLNYVHGDIRGVIKSYSLVKEQWDIAKPLHTEFLKTLYNEGVEVKLLKHLDNEGFFCLYCDTANKDISLLYKTLRKANENPQGFNSWIDLLNLCKQLKADDEAQDIEK